MLCELLFRQLKVASWTLLNCCWKLTAVFFTAETAMVERLPTVFQQIPVIPYILCCLDVACSSTLDLCISDALFKFCDTLRCTIVWQQQRLLGRFVYASQGYYPTQVFNLTVLSSYSFKIARASL